MVPCCADRQKDWSKVTMSDKDEFESGQDNISSDIKRTLNTA